jgi:dephospho-CoA kinase
MGSGKSTASDLFEELGVPVVDTDQIARDLVAPGSPALSEIEKSFGSSVIRDGQLDRVQLRERVFADPAARERLEGILHPAIRDELRRRVATLNSPYCVVAVPLLVEKGWEDEVDRVLVIDAAPEQQVLRTQARDGLTRETVESIIKTQASPQERLAKADDVIENNGDIASLREKVRMVHQRYLALAAAR